MGQEWHLGLQRSVRENPELAERLQVAQEGVWHADEAQLRLGDTRDGLGGRGGRGGRGGAEAGASADQALLVTGGAGGSGEAEATPGAWLTSPRGVHLPRHQRMRSPRDPLADHEVSAESSLGVSIWAPFPRLTLPVRSRPVSSHLLAGEPASSAQHLLGRAAALRPQQGGGMGAGKGGLVAHGSCRSCLTGIKAGVEPRGRARASRQAQARQGAVGARATRPLPGLAGTVPSLEASSSTCIEGTPCPRPVVGQGEGG